MDNGIQDLKDMIVEPNALEYDTYIPATFQLITESGSTRWGDLSILTISPAGIRCSNKFRIPVDPELSVKVRFNILSGASHESHNSVQQKELSDSRETPDKPGSNDKHFWEITGKIVGSITVHGHFQYAIRWSALTASEKEKLLRAIVDLTVKQRRELAAL